MKILIVMDVYQSNGNGTSISALRFTEVLRKHGHEVRSLAADGDDYVLPEREVWGLANTMHSQGFYWADSLTKHSQEIIREAVAWADVVHMMMPFMLTVTTKRIADEMGKPSTAAFHIQPENITSLVHLEKVGWVNHLLYYVLRKAIYSKFEYVHTPSLFMANELRKHGYKMKIVPISNGIDPSFRYRRDKRDKRFEGKIVIIMTGRYASEKRHDLLKKAAKLSKYSDKIQLILAGRGPLQAEYEKLSEGLANKPIYGTYNREELQHILAQSDLYVHCSDMESEAIACIEGFAMGLVPVISDSPLSATQQFALDKRSLFRAGDAKNLAQKMDYWIEHPEEKSEMERKYARFAKSYYLEQCVERFEEMLYKAMGTTKEAELAKIGLSKLA